MSSVVKDKNFKNWGIWRFTITFWLCMRLRSSQSLKTEFTWTLGTGPGARVHPKSTARWILAPASSLTNTKGSLSCRARMSVSLVGPQPPRTTSGISSKLISTSRSFRKANARKSWTGHSSTPSKMPTQSCSLKECLLLAWVQGPLTDRIQRVWNLFITNITMSTSLTRCKLKNKFHSDSTTVTESRSRLTAQ